MIGDVSESAAAKASTTSLASACVVVWVVAASTGPAAIGAAAVALGVAVGLSDRAAVRRILQPRPSLVLLGVVAGGSMAGVTYLLYPVLAHMLPFIATDTALLYSALRAPSLVIASIALAPVVVGEELVWRSAVQTPLVRRFGPRTGVAWAALAYGLAHAPLGSPVLVGVALLCGIAWGTLRAASASLVPTLVAHLVWDVLVLLWLPLEPR
jgi:membrane protease YdiL (CAAX protease family)